MFSIHLIQLIHFFVIIHTFSLITYLKSLDFCGRSKSYSNPKWIKNSTRQRTPISQRNRGSGCSPRKNTVTGVKAEPPKGRASFSLTFASIALSCYCPNNLYRTLSAIFCPKYSGIKLSLGPRRYKINRVLPRQTRRLAFTTNRSSCQMAYMTL